MGESTTLSPLISGTLSNVVTWYYEDDLLSWVAPHPSPYRSITYKAKETCTRGTVVTAYWDTQSYDSQGRIILTSHSESWTIYIQPNEPTSISLNYTSISLNVDETKQLTATLSPSSASQSVTWSVVSGSGYVSVSSSGVVTAKAAGTATVRATSKVDSSVYEDCTVNVSEPQPPTSISLNYTSLSMQVGATKQLEATVSPSEASQSVTWSVYSGSSYASVSSSGVVTAKAAGTAVIRATSTANSSVYKDCTVNVSNTPTSISLNYTSLIMFVGDTKQLTATVSPSGALQNVTWSVYSGSSYVSVSSSGVVTAKAAGTAVVRATSTANSSVYKDCTVNVPITPTSISLNYTSLNMFVGDTKQLTETVTPSRAWQDVTWSVYSGSSYASVSSTGLVTAKAVGTAIVRATSTANSSVYGDCIVNVLEPGTLYGNTLTIGSNATGSSYGVPYNTNYYYSTAQMLYTPREIGKAGEINSIAFKVASASTYATSEVNIYLGHKSTTFSSASDFVSSNLTLVYSGSPTLGQSTGWETMDFNQRSFTYNGTDNLVVVVTKKSSSLSSGLNYYYYTGSGFILYRGNNIDSNYGDVTNTTCEYSAFTFRPSVRFTFTDYTYNDGDKFYAKTAEGIEMGFKVISAANKICQVYGGISASSINSYTTGKLTIPEVVNGYTVTAIGFNAFYDCNKLTSVIIPNSVNSIESNAFEWCYGLTNVIIPSNVTSIENHPFTWCYGLTSIIVDAGNTVYDSRDNCNAIIETATNILLLGCKNTIIPNSVTTIGEDAFFGCTSLTSITIPSSVTKIGSFAFYGCSRLTSVTSLSDNPFTLDTSAFFNNSSDIDIYNQATLYVPFGKANTYRSTEGWNRFQNIVELEPEDPTVFIAESADGVPMTFKITDEAAKTCQIGTGNEPAININTTGNITLPIVVNGYTVNAIAANAFAGAAIGGVDIPNSIKRVGENAFKNCSSLYEPVSYIEEPFDIPESAFAGLPSKAVLTILYGAKGKYLAAKGWNVFSTIYDDQAIVNGIHYSVEKGESYTAWVESSEWNEYSGDVVIPETLTIGAESFTVIGIGSNAFRESQITSVTIPSTVVEHIGARAFENCLALRSLTSYIKEPKDESNASSSGSGFVNIPADATLYVPFGTKSLYEAAGGWNLFQNIVEMDNSTLDPQDEEFTDISEMENVLYIDDAEGIADGRMTFYVKMKNSVVAEGFFLRMYLPEGFTLMENLEGKLDVSLYSDGGRVDKSKIGFDDPIIDDDGSILINAYGKNGQTIDGNDGEVVRVRVHVPEGMPVGNYPILIKNGHVMDNRGTQWPKDAKPVITCKLHVAEKVRGDANGDASDKSVSSKKNDDVNAGDYITIIHYIQGLPYDNLDKTAADANGDGVVNGADLTAISNLKKYGSVSKPASNSRVARATKEREAE